MSLAFPSAKCNCIHRLSFGAAKMTLRVSCPVTASAKPTQAQIALRGLAHQWLVEEEIGLA